MFVVSRDSYTKLEKTVANNCIDRRWDLVSTRSLQVSETKTSQSFRLRKKSIIERTMQQIKDRTEYSDDQFPFKRKNCKLKDVKNWLRQFVGNHNKEIRLESTEPKKLQNVSNHASLSISFSNCIKIYSRSFSRFFAFSIDKESISMPL